MVCKGLHFINHLIGKVEMNFISLVGVRPWKTLRSYGVEKAIKLRNMINEVIVTMHPDPISSLQEYTVLKSTILKYCR